MSHSGGKDLIPIGVKELKKALWKKEFRDLFPDLKDKIKKFLTNPNCKCHQSLFNSLLHGKEKLEEYFGGPVTLLTKPVTEEQLRQKIFVLNVPKDQLQLELRRLPLGPKYISLTRYENEITAVVQLLT